MALQTTFSMLHHPACIPRCSRIPHLLTAMASKQAPVRTPFQLRRNQSKPSRSLPSNLAPPPPRSPTRPQSPKANTSPPTPAQPAPRDRRAIYIASLFGFFLALYPSVLAVGVRKDWERSKTLALTLVPDADVSDRWDAQGRRYDDEIELAETMMLMGRKRQKLVSQAKGEVLEVSVGTGRNMKYYDYALNLNQKEERGRDGKKERAGEREHLGGSVTGLVFNDKASVMVTEARKKFEELQRRKMPETRFRGRVEFVVGDAAAEEVIPRPGRGFDTIVQTMGLCSTTDPVGLLKRLGELCRKPTGKGEVGGAVAEGKFRREVVKVEEDEYNGGRILLLEHGRGYYDWLNNLLDGLAPSHADHYGCWWNRDIGAIVEQSGLEVEYIKRYHLGTTWEVVLRPKREEKIAVAAESDKREERSTGMFGWTAKAKPSR